MKKLHELSWASLATGFTVNWIASSSLFIILTGLGLSRLLSFALATLFQLTFWVNWPRIEKGMFK